MTPRTKRLPALDEMSGAQLSPQKAALELGVACLQA